MPVWLLTAWPLIRRYGPIAAAVVAVLLGWHAVAVHYRAQGRAESSARIVSDEASMQRGIYAIGLLRQTLAIKSAESDARARAYADSIKQDAADRAAADQRWAKSKVAQADLLHIVEQRKGSTMCPPSAALTKALEGL
jgi:hypothetical protein